MQTTSRISPKRNPVSRKAYQQDFFLQILLPIILFSLLLLALGFLASFNPSQDGINHTAVWAHISTIFMVIILVISGLAALALLVLIIFALAWLLSRLPEYSFIAQLYLQLFGGHIHNLADKISAPFIGIQAGWAGFRSLFKHKKNNNQTTE